ncbi:ImmA/IrrE family metallo-endopeptidase [Candidatus Hepatincola sp. Pdp]
MARIPKRPSMGNLEFTNNIDTRTFSSTEEVLQYAKDKGFVNNDNLNLKKLVQDNKEIELVFEDLEEDGCIYYDKNKKKYIIKINSLQAEVRQKFTLAHEYIHYLFHKDILEKPHSDTILYRDEAIKLDEDVIANQYAAELLMPENKFRLAVTECKGDTTEIAKKFGVSSLAVRYRAKDLEIDGHGL